MGKTVVLGITGSIAAYKAADIASQLKKRGVSVYGIMTAAAGKFISALTIESLTNHPVADDLFTRETPWEIEHIALAKRADVFLVAPATANFIGKYASGIADDLLTSTILATRAPVLIAPAMNTQMYQHSATQDNLALLKERGCQIINPASGELACGDVGEGKLAAVSEIVDYTMAQLELVKPAEGDNGSYAGPRNLVGKRVLISAGPTRENIDPVRYISNRSSGRMGYALAKMARQKGAEVTLVSGPVSMAPPVGIKPFFVETTLDMYDAMTEAFFDCDICIMAAAPADFTPQNYVSNKIKKQGMAGDDQLEILLKKTPDILSALQSRKGNRFLCGFAAETQHVEQYAREKMRRKGLDMIVANDVSRKDIGFDSGDNEVSIFLADGGRVDIPKADKESVAAHILDEIVEQIQ